MRFLLPLLLALSSLGATSTFYVDPAWGGTASGTPSQPWTTLTGKWGTINTALGSGPVIIYFSARLAGSDTNSNYGNGNAIDLTQKTVNGNLLTLDGWSFYNTSEVTPSWSAYSGTSKCIVDNIQSQNASHAKISDVTIHGFRIICTPATKIVTICGDNWTLEFCDCSQTVTSTSGPGVLIVPTSDGAHEGSSFYAPACTNINVISNVVHDTEGEAIYVGGGGSPLDGTPAAGYPSHSKITVAYNKISVAGEWGGQGDGIDVKGGLYNVVIRGNEITSLIYTGGIRCIVAQGQTNGATGTNLTIEKNYFHDCTAVSDGAIRIADSWGVPQGVVIRNNIFANIDGPGSSGVAPAGIIIDSCQDQQLVQNNTIYNCRGIAMGDTVAQSSVKWRNNLLLSNNSGGAQVSYKSTGTNDSDYNAYNQTLGFGGEGAHTIAVTTAALVNVAGADWRVAAGSALINAGQTQAGFSDDYAGTARPQGAAWDIGAYEYIFPLPPSFWAGSIRAGRVSKP